VGRFLLSVFALSALRIETGKTAPAISAKGFARRQALHKPLSNLLHPKNKTGPNGPVSFNRTSNVLQKVQR
jgi:hypothetical protein